jgi:hypothetical protein
MVVSFLAMAGGAGFQHSPVEPEDHHGAVPAD